MKNAINIENYESFYLDFLEGNLDETTSVLLLAFLDEHPELQVDCDMPVLDEEFPILDRMYKDQLKVWDESSSISHANIEPFLIAEKEGVLSAQQKQELQVFLAANKQYASDQQLYSFSTLQPELSVQYPNKKALKRKEILVLWPYISGAVAACIVVLFYLFPSVETIHLQSAARGMSRENPTFQQNPNDDNHLAVEPLIVQKKLKKTVVFPREIRKNAKVDILEVLPANELAVQDKLPTKFDPVTPKIIDPKSTEIQPSGDDYTLAMKNPVAPLTRKISEVIKKEVDYKKGSDAKENRKGFYLKIGSFEISTNRSTQPSRN